MAATDDFREQGNVAFRNGDFLKAAAAYTRAIKADPGNAILYSNRSLALFKLNKLPKALADAEQCTKLDATNVKGWYRQALVLEAQGHLEQAIQVLKEGSEAAAGAMCDLELTRQIKNLTRKIKDMGKDGGLRADTASSGDAGDRAAGRTALENGGRTPASAAEREALAFADAWMQYAQEQLQEHGSDFQPTVHFMPGTGTNMPEQPHEAACVLGAQAFSDPATLAEFVNFVRQKGENLKARAVVSIVPKSKVAFPQTWLNQLWPYSQQQDGVFVQLQALIPPTGGGEAGSGEAVRSSIKAAGKKGSKSGVKAAGAMQPKDDGKSADDQGASTKDASPSGKVEKLWFVRLGERSDGASFKARAPHELPHDLMPLPPLLR